MSLFHSLIIVFVKKLCEIRISNLSVIALRANKGKEVAVASKGFKRLRKGVASISSAQKAPLFRRFRYKAMEEHRLEWFNAQKKSKYASENRIDEHYLEVEFPTVHDTVRELGWGTFFLG
ncbi:hypothetical protein HAX54_011073 [Datura stramonium]|uniref:Uncharacterized protein n=1 Tax=Datura stramonium TaxID=4076 RepID=A0ABS8TJ65_DATST|nr:hypothetical protein [Datura stramonium]